MQEHRRWARQAKDPQVRVTRLEGFWKKYLPKAEGGTNPEISEYEDGFHVLSVAGCAWEMVRAYIEANRPQDALRMLDWLQMYDSKSQLINKPVN